MGKMKESPRCNVVSMRINDEEKKQLDKIIAESGKKNFGDAMRERLFGARKRRS